MSAKQLQLDTGTWLKDPTLTKCSPATRGIWIDMICAMHEHDRSGLLECNATQLARICRCSESEITNALLELRTNKTADIHDSNDVVTVINRRMKRDADIRNGTRERVEKFRVRKRNLPTTDEAKRVAGIFRRSLHTEWSEKEITAFRSAMPINIEDLALVERYYEKNRSNERAFLRTGLQAFCNNFRGEVDKARQWATRNPRTAALPGEQANGDKEPDGFREWLGERYSEKSGTPWSDIPASVKAEFRRERKL